MHNTIRDAQPLKEGHGVENLEAIVSQQITAAGRLGISSSPCAPSYKVLRHWGHDVSLVIDTSTPRAAEGYVSAKSEARSLTIGLPNALHVTICLLCWRSLGK